MIKRFPQTIKYTILLIFSFLALYPVFLMIVSSFKSNLEILTSPLGLPKSFSLENYLTVWNKVNFSGYLWNSIYVSALSIFSHPFCILFSSILFIKICL